MKQLAQKVRSFVKILLNIGEVGAIAESSDYVVRRSLGRVHGPFHTVVEHGAGSGVMTKELLKLLAPKGTLTVVESNPGFARSLRELGDPRMRVIESSIQEAMLPGGGLPEKADLVVSSIPFSFLKPEEQDAVIEHTARMLGEEGILIVFHQYSTLIKKTLEKYFQTVSVSFEPRNIFPCFILFAKGPNTGAR